MSNINYNELIGVRPNFDDTFNLVQERPDSWKSFITNQQFENNLSKIIHVFDAPYPSDANERKSIWIQGTYGTGKSHSTSVVKHLLSDDMSEIKEFLNSLSDRQLRANILAFRENHKVFPIVLRGRYTILNVKDMSYIIQEETRKALEKNHININIKTDYETALDLLNNKSYDSWWNSLLDEDLKIYCKTKEDIKKRLLEYDQDILGIISEKFRKDTNSSFGTSNIINWLKDVKNELKKNHYADFLLLIWDEFTSLLSGPECRSILNTVQDIAELGKAEDINHEPEGIYIFLVTHKTFEQTDAYQQKDAEERKLASARFITCSYEMQPNTTYHILSSTLNRKDEAKLSDLIKNRIHEDFSVCELIDRIAEQTIGDTNEIKEKIISLYPFHPYTAYLSTFVSRQIGETERSIFNFLNDESVGFKKFIKQDIDNEKFMSCSYIWDFFLKINESATSTLKMSEIINKYNMHLDDVKKNGLPYLNIFKAVLLLNILNSVVDSSEESNERNLVVPNIKNITDCFAGIYDKNTIETVLSYLDEHSIIIKSPDGIFEVSTSSISVDELNNTKKKYYQYFNDIVKAFETYPQALSSIKKIITTNNGFTVRNVKFIKLSTTLKNSQIEVNLNQSIEKSYSLNVVMLFSHGPNQFTDQSGIVERKGDEIEGFINTLSDRQEFENVVFVNCREKMQEIDFNRFIESYSRAEILNKTNPNDAKNEYNKSYGYIKRWCDEINNNGMMYICFRGQSEISDIRTLAKNISYKYIPFVFESGLDILKDSKKGTIWEEKTAKSAIEAILYSTKRDDMESKLSGGLITNLKCLLKDDEGNYIYDNEMTLSNNFTNHPIYKLSSKIDECLNDNNSNASIIDLSEKLKFVFMPPFGYYNNPISQAALCLALRKYIDKIFIYNEGTKVDKTVMRDIIEALFKFNQTGKASSKLKIRFSSEEEIELINLLNEIFNLKENGLIRVRWAIREKFTKLDAPLWIIKYLNKDANQKFINIIDDLFKFTIDADETITQTRMSSLLKNLENLKLEVINYFIKASSYEQNEGGKLLNVFIKQILKKVYQDNSEISENDYNYYINYLHEHMQGEISYWTEVEITTQLIQAKTFKNIPESTIQPSIISNDGEKVEDSSDDNNFIKDDYFNDILEYDAEKLKKIVYELCKESNEFYQILKKKMEK